MSNTLLQPAAFLAMLYGGVIIGIIYDVLRFFRQIGRRPFVCVVCDGLFVILATLVTACTLLFATGGTIRPYLIVGLLAGCFLEQWSLGYLVFHAFYVIRARL